jgi:uncharacterized protein involved in type VI secretion and phage assembly
MSESILDVLRDPEERRGDRIYGVVSGVVTNNQDPDGLGRVKVRFPWLSQSGEESWWARVAAPMAGPDRGVYFLPEVDDEVLVAFEHGDVRFPYVVGALWNGNQAPPEANADGENNMRTIKSRSGHIIRLDDSDGNGKIEIVDSGGKNSVVIDTAAGTLTISADGDVKLVSASGKILLEGAGVEIESSAGVKVHAAAKLDLVGDGPTTLKGAVVKIN